jgi:hypothetical protein
MHRDHQGPPAPDEGWIIDIHLEGRPVHFTIGHVALRRPDFRLLEIGRQRLAGCQENQNKWKKISPSHEIDCSLFLDFSSLAFTGI